MDIGDVLSDVLNIMIIITLLPTVLNVFSGIAGIDTSMIQPFLNLFTTLLPILLIVQLFTGLFSAFGGGRDEFGIGAILNVLILMMIFPTLLNAISSVTGTTLSFDVSGIMEIFNVLLPVILIIKLVESLAKAIK